MISFFKKIFNYVIRNDAAILISSNISFHDQKPILILVTNFGQFTFSYNGIIQSGYSNNYSILNLFYHIDFDGHNFNLNLRINNKEKYRDINEKLFKQIDLIQKKEYIKAWEL